MKYKYNSKENTLFFFQNSFSMSIYLIPFECLKIDTTYYFSIDLYDNFSVDVIDSRIQEFLTSEKIEYKIGDYAKFDWMKDGMSIFDGKNFVPII